MTTTGRGLAVTGPKLIYTENGECYGFSGLHQPSSGATSEAFNFKTDSKPIRFNMMWGVNWDEHGENAYLGIEMKYNDVSVYLSRGEMTSQAGQFLAYPFRIGPFIIPALTTCVIEVISSDAAIDQYVMLEGKEI